MNEEEDGDALERLLPPARGREGTDVGPTRLVARRSSGGAEGAGGPGSAIREDDGAEEGEDSSTSSCGVNEGTEGH